MRVPGQQPPGPACRPVPRASGRGFVTGAGRRSELDRKRFEGLWSRRIGEDAGAVFAELEALYREPHRRYHTPAHVEHCLGCFDLAADRMEDPDAVETALWFHDAIYDVPARDNELRSAELFAARAGGRGEERFRSKVYRLIMATTHREPPVTIDESFIVDIDLSSFGLPWEEFLRDSLAVREEFAMVPDADFYPGQKKFVESLLARPTFCFTEFFRDRHEVRVRKNVERLFAKLQAQGLV